MIHRVRLQNFKGFSDTTFELRKFNIFIGENGTGKSSLIQALMLLKQSVAQGRFRIDGPFVLASEPDEFWYRRNGDLPLSIEVEGRHPHIPLPDVDPADAVSFLLRITLRKNTLTRQRGELRIGRKEPIVIEWRVEGGNNRLERQFGEVKMILDPSGGIADPFGQTGYSYNSPLKSDSLEPFNDLRRVIPSEIGRIFYVPPTRGMDKAKYSLLDRPSLDLQSHAEDRHPDQWAASSLAYQRDLEEGISASMSRILGRTFRATVQPGPNVQPQSGFDGIRIAIAGEGAGMGKALIAIAQVLAAPKGSLVGIDEPELSLHPIGLRRLVREIVRIANERDLQIIFTTHTELTLHSLSELVGKGEVRSGEMGYYIFDRRDGECQARKSDVSPEGNIIEGPVAGFWLGEDPEDRRS